MDDLAIIGGGPAGVAAGIYAARKKMQTTLITDTFGGQSLVSDNVENWIGEVRISGFDLAKKMEDHLRAQASVTVKDGERVVRIERSEGGFTLTTDKGSSIQARTVLVASGSFRKRLDVPGEREREGKGVFFCSICDAPLMGGKRVVVVGGGNAGLEAVIDLLPYAEKVYLLHRRDTLKGDAVTAERIKKEAKVEIVYNAETREIGGGGDAVEFLKYRDVKSGEEKQLQVNGIFVAVGALPSSELVKDLVFRNERGEVVVDSKTQKTSCEGVWAAGDVTDVLYKQNNISAGDAVKAVLNIYEYLQKLSKNGK